MEAFLESARLAWNPVGETRSRHEDGTLTFLSVLGPYIGIVIACNLFALGAQQFFFECVFSQLGSEMSDSPLLKNDWALRFMSVLGALLPVGAVALLPASAFRPSSRNEITAGLIVVSGAWAFYGAMLGAFSYFVSGILVLGNLESGFAAFVVLSSLSGFVTIGILAVVWLRITLSVFAIGVPRTLLVSAVAALAIAGMVASFVYLVKDIPIAET